jgi:HEAT repeat protein
MMKKRILAVLAAGLIVAAFASISSLAAGPVEKPVSIADRVTLLLAKFPASTQAGKDALCADLVRLGPAGIADLCGRLLPPNAGDNGPVEYALNGLAVHVGRPGAEFERRMFVAAVLGSLRRPADPEAKAFLISQVQLAGRAEAAEPLAKFLSDERLVEPAARALVALRSPDAAQHLAKALDAARGPARAILIKALGETGSRVAIGRLLKYAESDDPAARRAALFALAESGDPAAEAALDRARIAAPPYERAQAPALYLRFARRLISTGRIEAGLRICRSLLASHVAPGESAVAGEALAVIVESRGAGALSELLTAMDADDAGLRGQALFLANRIPGPEATGRWVEKARRMSPDIAAEIAGMLARRGDKAAWPYIRSVLGGAEESVRLAAIPAVPTLGGAEGLAALWPFLKTGSEAEIQAVHQALLQYPAEAVVPEAVRLLTEAPPSGRAALIDILGEKGAVEHIDLVHEAARSETPAVRLAAYRALGGLLSPPDIPKLIDLLIASTDADEDAAIQAAVVSAAAAEPRSEKRADAVLTAFADRSPAEKAEVLRLLPRLPGPRALEAVVAETKSPDVQVRGAAVYALSRWPDDAAAAPLLDVVKTATDRKLFLLGLEGYARLISESRLPDEKKLALLRDALGLAREETDKKTVLRALVSVRTMEAFLLLADRLASPGLETEAARALFEMAAYQEPEERWLSAHQPVSILRRAADLLEDAAEREAAGKTIDERLRQGGFVRLFDGRSLAGWKGLVADPPKRAKMAPEELRAAQAEADERMRAHWRIEDGALVFDGAGESLCTGRDYGDFELLADWLIGPKGDSGLYLRGSPQVQIWDPAENPEGSGGLYNNQKGSSKPLEKADRPAGEWNAFRVIMIGDRVTVYLNDKLVVDNVALENYWERDKPIYPVGQIELQAHGNPLRFRNVYLREIPRDPAAAAQEILSAEEAREGFAPLFNGRDLSGWIGNTSGYVPENGRIVVHPELGSGNLYTEKDFGDFILRFEFKLTPGANNGIGVRAPVEGDAAYEGLEIQILEDSSPMYRDLAPDQYHGSVYGIAPAKRGFLKPAGEWNAEEIALVGRRASVKVNGTTVVDADLDEATAGGPMDGRDHPGLRRTTGRIGFLGHGSALEFRRIRIKEIGSAESR